MFFKSAYRALAIFLAMAFATMAFGAATKVNQSIVRGTEAEIRALTGDYTQQKGYASDQNYAELLWNGSAWVWSPMCQNVYRLRADVTAPTDTNENTLATYTLPKVGTEDAVRVAGFITATNNANVKTVRVNVGSVGSLAQGLQTDIASNGAYNFVTEMRNQASASAQEWFSNNKAIFGATSGTVSTTAKDTGTAGKIITVTIQKATAGDSIVLVWLDISICGTGVP